MMAVGIICLVVFCFIVGREAGERKAQLDGLSEYAEAIHNNLITLIDLVQKEKEKSEDERKEPQEK